MFRREVENEAAADRAAHDDGSREIECIANVDHHPRIALGGELVLLGLEADGRQRFAVPRHVEHDDAVVSRDHRVVEEVAELAAIGARGVQADERDATPGFLDVESVRTARQREMAIAADDRLEGGFHGVRLLTSTRAAR